MITVLIAEGANNMEVPCRIFETMKDARDFCDPLFVKLGVLSHMFDGDVQYDADLEEEWEKNGNNDISEELFTHFYYGCGGVYRFTLKEIPFNTKFVGFDLD
jgi:hypothetical protein